MRTALQRGGVGVVVVPGEIFLAGAGCAGAHGQLIGLAAALQAPVLHAFGGKGRAPAGPTGPGREQFSRERVTEVSGDGRAALQAPGADDR